jgi:hypothetical protein
MKPRTCPNCQKEIPVDKGFYFDENMNILCCECDNVILDLEFKIQAEERKDE